MVVGTWCTMVRDSLVPNGPCAKQRRQAEEVLLYAWGTEMQRINGVPQVTQEIEL